MDIFWERRFETGIMLIDEQHRMLLFLCKKLECALKMRRNAIVIKLITLEIRRFAEFHFFSEESIMSEIEYPDLESHSLLHAELIVVLNEIMHDLNSGNNAESADDFLRILYHWTIGHVSTADKSLSDYAENANARPIGAEFYEKFLSSHTN